MKCFTVQNLIDDLMEFNPQAKILNTITISYNGKTKQETQEMMITGELE